MLPYSSMKKTGCLLFREVKAMQAPAVPQVQGLGDWKETPRTTRISRSSREIRTNLQSSQLTRQLVAGDATDLSNNLHNLEVITNTYKTPLPLTFATLQL